MMLKKLVSLVLLVKLELERITDHGWRKLTGLPLLKRSKITPQLFLGGQYSTRGLTNLINREISGIVNMRMTTPIVLENMNVEILHLPTPDTEAPSMQMLEKGIQFIQRKINDGKKVYIHCKHGEGRGPTMAIAYLISNGMTLEDAIKTVKTVRTFINPTIPQLERLKELEKKYQIIN